MIRPVYRLLGIPACAALAALAGTGASFAGVPGSADAAVPVATCLAVPACYVGDVPASGCVDFSDLAAAERATEGVLFDAWAAPEFELPTTAGRMFSLHARRGTHVAVVLLADRCAESLATLPILRTLRDRFAGADLEIVPVFVASGDADALAERAVEWGLPFPLVVSEDRAIGQAYGSRLLPATLLIDETGRVRRKLVGVEDEATLDAAIAELLADSYPLVEPR